MPYITTKSGTTLFYKDWGHGRPMVFLHAWAMSSAIWEYNMLHFESLGYRCIAFDRRGHGRSDDPCKGFDFDTLAGDIDDVLEALDLRDIILVAHSMGGAEALRYVSRFNGKGRVAKLILLAAPECLARSADNPDGVDPELSEMGLREIAEDFTKWIDENTYPFYLADKFEVSDGIVRWSIDMMMHTSLQVAINCRRAIFYADLRPDARRINIPTLVIHGDADASIPFWCGQSLSRNISGCVFKPYAGAPHGLIISHARQIREDILQFIKD
jgi:non-heme chloroperoxidase